MDVPVKQMMRRLTALLFVLMVLFSPVLERVAAAAGRTEQSAWTEIAKSKKKKKNTATPRATKTPKPTATPAPAMTEEPEATPAGPIIEPQAIADYLFVYGRLPDNFLTKKEAQALGWDSYRNYVSDVAPGMSIGGDRFGNYEGLLPKKSGRQYYECDCYYTGGKRNAYRIIFSNDGLVFYTEDHYRTFTEMHPSVPGTTRAP